jgi:hypothetical protein
MIVLLTKFPWEMFPALRRLPSQWFVRGVRPRAFHQNGARRQTDQKAGRESSDSGFNNVLIERTEAAAAASMSEQDNTGSFIRGLQLAAKHH